MGRSTRKIVPVLSDVSDDSMYNATPVPDPFYKKMEEWTERRRTLQFSPTYFSPVNNGYESSASNESGGNYCRSVDSESSYQYNERIKRENRCVKCCSIMSFIACFVGCISMA